MKRILLFAAIMLAFAAGCSSNNGESDKGAQSSEVETISLIANSAWPEDNFMTDGLIELSEKVNEYTNGQVEIDVKPNGELGYEGTELLGAVRDNLVPITDMLAF